MHLGSFCSVIMGVAPGVCHKKVVATLRGRFPPPSAFTGALGSELFVHDDHSPCLAFYVPTTPTRSSRESRDESPEPARTDQPHAFSGSRLSTLDFSPVERSDCRLSVRSNHDFSAISLRVPHAEPTA